MTRKFRLVKPYFGGPELGTIITSDDNYQYVTSLGDMTQIPEKYIQEQPQLMAEHWEEIHTEMITSPDGRLGVLRVSDGTTVFEGDTLLLGGDELFVVNDFDIADDGSDLIGGIDGDDETSYIYARSMNYKVHKTLEEYAKEKEQEDADILHEVVADVEFYNAVKDFSAIKIAKAITLLSAILHDKLNEQS